MKSINHWQKFKAWFQSFLNIIENPTFQAIVTLLASLATILAVYLAIVAIEHADNQFTLNSESSDRLFNIQLENSKALNDSLISQVQQLQKITERQLSITDEQLGLSKRSLKNQIASGRPKLLVLGSEVPDTSVQNGLFAPKINTRVTNNGERYALKSSMRSFLTYGDFTVVLTRPADRETITYEPKSDITHTYLPKFPLKYRHDFYYVYELKYYDDALNQTFTQAYFTRYFWFRDKYEFAFCKDDEKRRLFERINAELKSKGEPPLSWE